VRGITLREIESKQYFHRKKASWKKLISLPLLFCPFQLKGCGAIVRVREERVQLYIRNKHSTLEHEMEKLHGFQPVALQPGETRTMENAPP
jgi:hypothetical protein